MTVEDAVRRLIEAVGEQPKDVVELRIKPDLIEATVYVRNDDGTPKLTESGAGIETRLKTAHTTIIVH